jgi:micrococcal nuclease
MFGIGKLVLGAALTAGAVGTSVAVATVADTSETDRGVVARVVDGDTLDVEIGGAVQRVRLLNIDTPETVDPERPVQCLGPEATAFLEGLLPGGTPVTLEYDKERTDRYDRTLAGVFTGDGALVNAEIARQGLAAAVIVGDNDRFYPPVAQARDEAVAAARGLYSPDVACAVPAQVQAVTTALAGLPAVEAQTTPSDLDGTAAAAAAAAATARALHQAFDDGRLGVAWSALTAEQQQRLTGVVTAGREKAQQAETAARTAAAAARDRAAAAARAEEERRQAEARERAAHVERERSAAQERARRAEEQAAARRREAEKKAESPKKPETSKKSDTSTSEGGSGGPPGYTGPRCYAPGGKTWRPC